ncbi:inositol phosphate phosphatase SopB [Endozoicomonas elysicola]|nr:inositol phosphate phosphatase SopB [Endozoicomonas elysicola]
MADDQQPTKLSQKSTEQPIDAHNLAHFNNDSLTLEEDADNTAPSLEIREPSPVLEKASTERQQSDISEDFGLPETFEEPLINDDLDEEKLSADEELSVSSSGLPSRVVQTASTTQTPLSIAPLDDTAPEASRKAENDALQTEKKRTVKREIKVSSQTELPLYKTPVSLRLGFKSRKAGDSELTRPFQNKIASGISKMPAAQKTPPKTITRKAIPLPDASLQKGAHKSSSARLNQQLMLQKQPEKTAISDIVEKEAKVAFQSTDTRTLSAPDQQTGERVPALASDSLTSLSEKPITESRTPTSLARASERQVTPIGHSNINPFAGGKAFKFNGQAKDIGCRLQLRLTPENIGQSSIEQPAFFLKIEEDLIPPATSEHSSSALAITTKTHRHLKVTILINWDNPSSSTAITINRQVTPEVFAALCAQLNKNEAFVLPVDKSQLSALQSEQLLALEGAHALEEPGKVTEMSTVENSTEPFFSSNQPILAPKIPTKPPVEELSSFSQPEQPEAVEYQPAFSGTLPAKTADETNLTVSKLYSDWKSFPVEERLSVSKQRVISTGKPATNKEPQLQLPITEEIIHGSFENLKEARNKSLPESTQAIASRQGNRDLYSTAEKSRVCAHTPLSAIFSGSERVKPMAVRQKPNELTPKVSTLPDFEKMKASASKVQTELDAKTIQIPFFALKDASGKSLKNDTSGPLDKTASYHASSRQVLPLTGEGTISTSALEEHASLSGETTNVKNSQTETLTVTTGAEVTSFSAEKPVITSEEIVSAAHQAQGKVLDNGIYLTTLPEERIVNPATTEESAPDKQHWEETVLDNGTYLTTLPGKEPSNRAEPIPSTDKDGYEVPRTQVQFPPEPEGRLPLMVEEDKYDDDGIYLKPRSKQDQPLPPIELRRTSNSIEDGYKAQLITGAGASHVHIPQTSPNENDDYEVPVQQGTSHVAVENNSSDDENEYEEILSSRIEALKQKADTLKQNRVLTGTETVSEQTHLKLIEILVEKGFTEKEAKRQTPLFCIFDDVIAINGIMQTEFFSEKSNAAFKGISQALIDSGQPVDKAFAIAHAIVRDAKKEYKAETDKNWKRKARNLLRSNNAKKKLFNDYLPEAARNQGIVITIKGSAFTVHTKDENLTPAVLRPSSPGQVKASIQERPLPPPPIAAASSTSQNELRVIHSELPLADSHKNTYTDDSDGTYESINSQPPASSASDTLDDGYLAPTPFKDTMLDHDTSYQGNTSVVQSPSFIPVNQPSTSTDNGLDALVPFPSVHEDFETKHFYHDPDLLASPSSDSEDLENIDHQVDDTLRSLNNSLERNASLVHPEVAEQQISMSEEGKQKLVRRLLEKGYEPKKTEQIILLALANGSSDATQRILRQKFAKEKYNHACKILEQRLLLSGTPEDQVYDTAQQWVLQAKLAYEAATSGAKGKLNYPTDKSRKKLFNEKLCDIAHENGLALTANHLKHRDTKLSPSVKGKEKSEKLKNEDTASSHDDSFVMVKPVVSDEYSLKHRYLSSPLFSPEETNSRRTHHYRPLADCLNDRSQEEKRILTKATLNREQLINQLSADIGRNSVEARLTLNGTDYYHLSESTLGNGLTDLYDVFLQRAGVAKKPQRQHLLDIMLDSTHQGAYAAHQDLCNNLANKHVDDLHKKFEIVPESILLTKPADWMFVEGDEHSRAYVVKPDCSHRCVYFSLAPDRETLTIRKVYEASLSLVKLSNEKEVSGTSKGVRIETQYTLGLHDDSKNNVDLVTATEISGMLDQGSPQAPVVLLDNRQHGSIRETEYLKSSLSDEASSSSSAGTPQAYSEENTPDYLDPVSPHYMPLEREGSQESDDTSVDWAEEPFYEAVTTTDTLDRKSLEESRNILSSLRTTDDHTSLTSSPFTSIERAYEIVASPEEISKFKGTFEALQSKVHELEPVIQQMTLVKANYDLADWHLAGFAHELEGLEKSPVPGSTPDGEALARQIGEMKNEIANWSRHIECAKQSDFRHINNYTHLVNRLFDIADSVLEKFPDKRNQKINLHKKLKEIETVKSQEKDKSKDKVQLTPNELLYKLKQRYMLHSTGAGYVKNTVGYVSSLAYFINDMMIQLDLEAAYEQATIQRLAADTKPFIIEQYLKDDEGQWHHVIHEYTPAPYLDYNGSEPFELPYAGRAAPSMERDTKHAVNMYAYKMTVDGKIVDQYTRVGTPYAHMESRKEDIQTISCQRWREILVNILVTEKKEELDRILAGSDSSAEIELPIAYTNLMSPDGFRTPEAKALLKAFGKKELAKNLDNERAWIMNIHKTMENLHQVLDEQGQLVVMCNDVPKKVKVKLQPFMFVTPCNQLAFNRVFDPFGGLWKITHDINKEELKKLTGTKGTYGGYLSQKMDKLTEDEKKEACELTDWLWKHVSSNNSFEFGIKVRRLLFILKVSRMLGCKSNKDRTGRVCVKDQALKTSATYKDHKGKDCSSQKAQEISSKHESYQMVHGGHVHIQQYCTGVPGSKIDSTVKGGIDKVFDVILRQNIIPTHMTVYDGEI